jgi:hypothetical protein
VMDERHSRDQIITLLILVCQQAGVGRQLLSSVAFAHFPDPCRSM